MTLFRAERRRLIKRRVTRYMLLVATLVLGAIVAGTWLANHKIGPAERAEAERAAEASYQENVRLSEEYRARCEEAKAKGDPTGEFPMDCEAFAPPPRAAFDSRSYLPPSFNFKEGFPDTISIFAGVLALVAFIVGASFVGAEWHTGGMMNLLLWQPRRLKVFFVKLGTLLSGTFATTVLFGALWTGAFWLIATYRGSTANMTLGTWQSFGLTGLRALALILLAAALGFGVASLGRHSAMALGLAIGVAFVGFVGVAIGLSLVGVKFMERYLWPIYIQAWLEKKQVLEDWSSCQFNVSQGICEPATFTITWQHSGAIFAVVLVLVTGLAAWSMWRRDVT